MLIKSKNMIRPTIRPSPVVCKPSFPKEGDFMYKIMYPDPTVRIQRKMQSIYNVEDYQKMLRRNYAYWNLDVHEADRIIASIPTKTYVPKIPIVPERHIDYLDRVKVTCTVKGDRVRVSIIPHMADLYEKYYKHYKIPPLAKQLIAFKKLGYSDTFLEKMITSQDTKIQKAKKFDAVFEKMFNKAPVKIKKSIEKKVILDDDEEEEELADDAPPEEEEDPDPEEEPEEEYVSEPEVDGD